MRRGEIRWASLAAPDGSGPGFRRPMLVIQSNEFNDSRIQTVVCAVITSNLRLAQAPGNVLLSKRSSGLKKESVANVSQLVTIDRRFLSDAQARLPIRKLREVDDGIRLVLAI
jgi:mRNA interferase MazF